MFEGLKKKVEKAAVLTGIGLATAVATGEAQEQKTAEDVLKDDGHKIGMTQTGQEKTADAKTNTTAFYPEENTQNLDPAAKIERLYKCRDEYLKYMKDPTYKQRLTKEMYGDQKIDASKQEKIDSELSNREKIIKNILLTTADESKPDSVQAEYINFQSNMLETRFRNVYYYLSGIVSNQYRFDDSPFNSIRDKYINPKYFNWRNEGNWNNTKLKSTFNDLRKKAEKLGYISNNVFNMDDYPELKNDRRYKELKDQLELSDESINILMGYIA
ncbi:MAG: hypothetical protein WC908_01280 [Candidatus Paceibacterota bacterium]